MQPLQRLLARNFLSYCLLFRYIRVSSSVPFSFNFDYISSCEPDTRYLNLLIFVTFDQELHTYVYTRFHEHGAVGLRSKVLNNEFWNPFVARKFSSVCPIFHFWRYNQILLECFTFTGSVQMYIFSFSTKPSNIVEIFLQKSLKMRREYLR